MREDDLLDSDFTLDLDLLFSPLKLMTSPAPRQFFKDRRSLFKITIENSRHYIVNNRQLDTKVWRVKVTRGDDFKRG